MLHYFHFTVTIVVQQLHRCPCFIDLLLVCAATAGHLVSNQFAPHHWPQSSASVGGYVNSSTDLRIFDFTSFPFYFACRRILRRRRISFLSRRFPPTFFSRLPDNSVVCPPFFISFVFDLFRLIWFLVSDSESGLGPVFFKSTCFCFMKGRSYEFAFCFRASILDYSDSSKLGKLFRLKTVSF